MNKKGVLQKMRTVNTSPVSYFLSLDGSEIAVNELIGRSITINFEGFHCLSCGKDKKIYRQGHCYECFYEQPAVGDWVIKPELSTAHLGIEDRNIDFERAVQLKPHIVYLALSSEIKVGVTRKSQIPTRWIDQGANEAIPVLEVPNRYLAGIAEVALKKFVADKTNWRKMLKNEVPKVNLSLEREKLIKHLPKSVQKYVLSEEKMKLEYPILDYPKSVASLNLTKKRIFNGILKGVKGQYLIFEDDTVFNVRSNEGTVVTLNV
jgi:hypothetical protein